MTMRRRSPRSRSRRGPRRGLAWFNESFIPTAVAIGAESIVDLTPSAVIPDGYAGGFTVIRMIGQLELTSQTANSDVFGALGIMVASRSAVSLAGAMPDPIIDLVDWYYHQHWFNNTASVGDMEAQGRTLFDIRSARKIRGEDRTLAGVLVNNGASAAAIKWRLSVRLLLQRS